MVDIYWEPSRPMRDLCIALNKRFHTGYWQSYTDYFEPYVVTVNPIIEETTPTVVLTVTVQKAFLALAQRDLREFAVYWSVVGGWLVANEDYEYRDGKCWAVTLTIVGESKWVPVSDKWVETLVRALGPEIVLHPMQKRVFKTDTGRFSCTQPNMANEPSVVVGVDPAAPGEDFTSVVMRQPEPGVRVETVHASGDKCSFMGPSGKVVSLLWIGKLPYQFPGPHFPHGTAIVQTSEGKIQVRCAQDFKRQYREMD